MEWGPEVPLKGRMPNLGNVVAAPTPAGGLEEEMQAVEVAVVEATVVRPGTRVWTTNVLATLMAPMTRRRPLERW